MKTESELKELYQSTVDRFKKANIEFLEAVASYEPIERVRIKNVECDGIMAELTLLRKIMGVD